LSCPKTATPYIVKPNVNIKIRPIVERKPASKPMSEFLNGPSLVNGPIKKYPCARPISKPRNRGVNPNRYAGKFFKIARVTADEVIGVAK